MTPVERAELAGVRAELSAAHAEIDRLRAHTLEAARTADRDNAEREAHP